MDDYESRIEQKKEARDLEEGSDIIKYGAIAVIIVIIVTVFGFVFLFGSSSPENLYANTTAGEGLDPTLVSSRTQLQENAVTIYYYGDFQCPHCASFEENYLPQLIRDYIAEGKVRFVFKPVAFLNQNSYRAALAAQCVWNQNPDAYWEWHSKVFSEQGSGEWASTDNLVRYSRNVEGVNASLIRSCLESEEYGDAVRRHQNEASNMGVSSTPALVINGTVVNGNNYDRVQSTIESALRQHTS